MSTCFLTFISAEEEVGQGGEDSILDPPPKGKGELLTIDGDPFVEEGDISDSVSDKVTGFCKCLIFSKSGFARFSNFSGCQK